MPGGIGPIDRQLALNCSSLDASRRVAAGCNERDIFYNLSVGRVHYSPVTERLYFVASAHLPMEGVLQAVMQGFGKSLVVRQLHLDSHGCAWVARCPKLEQFRHVRRFARDPP